MKCAGERYKWGYLVVKSHEWTLATGVRGSEPNDFLDSHKSALPPLAPRHRRTLRRSRARLGCSFAADALPARCLSSTQGNITASQWNTPATTNAIPCSVPSSDLPADRGVTYELRRRMHKEGMAANIEQLDRCALRYALILAKC